MTSYVADGPARPTVQHAYFDCWHFTEGGRVVYPPRPSTPAEEVALRWCATCTTLPRTSGDSGAVRSGRQCPCSPGLVQQGVECDYCGEGLA